MPDDEIKLTSVTNEAKVVSPDQPVEPSKPKLTTTNTWTLEREMTPAEKKAWDIELKESSSFMCDNQEDRDVLDSRLTELKQLLGKSTGNRKVQYEVLIHLLDDFIKDMFD